MEHTEEIQPCAQCNQIGKWLLYDGRRLCTAHAHHALHWTKYDTTSPLFPYTASWLQQADVATRAGQVVPPLPNRQIIRFIKMVNGRVTRAEQDDPEAIPTEDGRRLLAKQQEVANRRAERKAVKDAKIASAAAYNAHLAKCADERKKKDEERLKKTAEREAKKLAVAAAKEAKEAKEAAEYQAKMIAKAKPIILPPVAFTDIPRIIPVREPAVILVKATPVPKMTTVPKMTAVSKMTVVKPTKPVKTTPRKASSRPPKPLCRECGRKATHGLMVDSIAIVCSSHAALGMVDICAKSCEYPLCTDYARWGLKGGKKQFCRAHAGPTMVSIGLKKCAEPNCGVDARWGLPGGELMWCRAHRKLDSVNLKWRCIAENCYKPPQFGKPVNDTRNHYCEEHKTSDMINVRAKRCIAEDCMGRATFLTMADKYPSWCSEHRPEDSYEWKRYLCCVDPCNKHAIYEIGDKKYCEACRPSEATLIPRQPIKFGDMNMAIYCQRAECIRAPAYGESAPMRCAEHAESGDQRLKNWPCQWCKEAGEYAVDDAYACEKCYHTIIKKLKGRALCKYCDITEKTEHICKTCHSRSRPSEWAIVRHLRKEIADPLIYDKRIDGCTSYRPDITYLKDAHVVIVEIDESQHKNYTCELARMNGIVSGIGGRPVTFIRFNPDEQNGAGQIDMAERVAVLVTTVRRYLAEPPAAFRVELVHLYYDGESVRTEDITGKVCV